jgi:phosphomannomutase
MLAALHATRDAPLAAALILGLRAERGRDLREIVSEWPEFHLVKWKVPRPDRPLEEAFDAVRRSAPEGAEEDLRDGLRLSWPEEKSWLHLRPSGTEPVVRIMAETPERDRAEALARLVRDALDGIAIRDSGG